MKWFVMLLLSFALSLRAATLVSDGTLSDTQTQVDAAVDGDIVALPSGSFTWAGSLTISGKGIHLRGNGSGRVVARSIGANTIGTGAKTFTVNASGLNITAGQTMVILATGGERDGSGNGTGNIPLVFGTVTSYSGTTLVMNITDVSYSGTYNMWIILSNPTTTITHNHATNPLLEITEDASHHVEVSGFRASIGVASPRKIRVSAGGKPVLIHDMWFDAQGTSVGIEFNSRHGIVWNCSFVMLVAGDTSSMGFKLVDSSFNTWLLPSTMGTNDVGGTNNLYVEDCDFHAFATGFDADENGRVVVRHCLFNQSSMGGSHGPDTSNFGVRHLEIYKNECVFNEIGGSPDVETMNLDKWMLLRGGTGIVASNVLPNIISSAWSDKLEIKLACWQLQHNAGPNACWGANAVGIQYPSPRQIGMGNVTGSGLDGLGRSVDSVTYVGDLELLYIWGNTGTFVSAPSDFGGPECTSPDNASSYIVEGRDYTNGIAKPLWAPYAYPHPMRTDSSAATFSAALRGTVRLSGPVKLQ